MLMNTNASVKLTTVSTSNVVFTVSPSKTFQLDICYLLLKKNYALLELLLL